MVYSGLPGNLFELNSMNPLHGIAKLIVFEKEKIEKARMTKQNV